jgi:hypothetical protein
MLNQELFDKVVGTYHTIDEMIRFSEMVSKMYKLIYEDKLERKEFTEDNFESDWWYAKYKELLLIKYKKL